MNSKKLTHFATMLREEKGRLKGIMGRIEETGLGSEMRDSLSELSTYDNHPADIGDELFERSKDLALRDNAHIMLEHVEKALGRIESGTFGKCETCGKEIAEARLEALPWVNECIDCKKREETIDPTPRPLEEDLLTPPFKRTFLDAADMEFVGFDGEDSWQAVARYGTSDGPQDVGGARDYQHLYTDPGERDGIVDLADSIPNDTSGSVYQGEMSFKDFLRREELEEDQLPEELSPHNK